MKLIGEFEIVDHGIEHEQYWRGCGPTFTSYEDIATGIGENFAEAVYDALDTLVENDWNVKGMEKRICKQIGKRSLPKRPKVPMKENECHYYVSILVKEKFMDDEMRPIG